jgi:hypothetical protein
LIRRRLPAFLAATMLLVAFATPASAGDRAQSRHDQIVAHWTAARMAAATPRDFSFDFARGFVPNRPPGGGGGSSTAGASWTGGGLVLQASGKVYFNMGGGAYVCSGAVANDSRGGYSLVLTAAHCAYDEVARQFATNWLFIPNFDGSPTFTCAQTVHGCWTAQALVVHQGYASAGGFNTQATLHDFAFAVVGPGGKSGGQLDAVVGSFPITFSSFSDGTQMYAFGYPAAGKYKGKDLTYCAGPVFSDPYNDGLTYGMTCNMTGGSSGGPWLSGFNTSTGSGTLSSLNSYGYSGVRAMHGPKFNSKTGNVHSAANSATTNTIVP